MRLKTRAALMTAATGVMSLGANWASAQFASFNGINPYVQDFNGLPGAAGGTSQATFPGAAATATGPYALDAAPVLGTNVSGWYVARPTGTVAPFFLVTEGANAQLGAAASAGAVDNADRALGTVSTTASQMRMGALIKNDSASTYGSLTLTFDMEQWRNGGSGNVNTSPFTYQIVPAASAASASISGTSGTFIAVTAGNLVSKVSGTNAAAVDGNVAANRNPAQTVTLSNIIWSAGDVLVVRWDDTNETGADDIIALDNFNLTGVAAGKSLTWKGPDGAAWNTNAANQVWLAAGQPSGFANADFATFGDATGQLNVAVDAAGVTPTNTAATATTGGYTFAGGKIGGSFSKNGAGTLVLASPNAFSSSTMTGGTVETRNSGAFGTSAVSLGNIVWKVTTADHVMTNAFTFSGTATLQTSVALDLNGATLDSAVGSTLTIENTSASPVLYPNTGNLNGNLRIKTGVVKYGGTTDGALFPDSTILTVDAGATFDFGLNGETMGGIEGAGKIILKDTPGSFLNLQATGDRTFSGILEGTTTNATTVGLNQNGGGVLTLSGKSTYDAPTTINSGRIIVGDNVLLNTPGPLGNNAKPLTINTPAAVGATNSLRIGGAFEFAKPIIINMGGTSTGFISIGASTDVDALYSGPITLNTTAAVGVPTRQFQVSAGNTTVTKAATISGVISSGTNVIGVEKINAGTVVLGGPNTYLGPTTVTGGVLRITGSANASSGFTIADGAALEIGSSQRLQTLTIPGAAGTGQLRFTATGPVKALTLGNNVADTPLVAPATFKLDLLGNAAVVDYAAVNEVATLQTTRGLIVKGYNATGPTFNNGDWKGTSGVTSSVAQADGSRAVGYALASEVLVNGRTDFLGQTPDSTSVLLRLTLAGDATLDGAVDFNDLVPLAQNYNTTVSAVSDGWWARGDFTYDGVVDFNDLVKLAQNYNTALPSAPIPGASAGFEADMAAAFAAVPEPASLSFLGIGAALLLGGGRRRRRAR